MCMCDRACVRIRLRVSLLVTVKDRVSVSEWVFFVFLSLCLSVCLLICLSVCLWQSEWVFSIPWHLRAVSTVCLCICLFVCLWQSEWVFSLPWHETVSAVCLSVCVSVCLFVCLHVCLSVCLWQSEWVFSIPWQWQAVNPVQRLCSQLHIRLWTLPRCQRTGNRLHTSIAHQRPTVSLSVLSVCLSLCLTSYFSVNSFADVRCVSLCRVIAMGGYWFSAGYWIRIADTWNLAKSAFSWIGFL